MHEVRQQHIGMFDGTVQKMDLIMFAGMLRDGQSSSRSLKRGSNTAQCCHQTVKRLNIIMSAGVRCPTYSSNRFTKPGNNSL